MTYKYKIFKGIKTIEFGVILVILFSFFFFMPFKTSITGAGDSAGYYFYLPASFLHYDIETLDKTNLKRKQYSNRGADKLPKLENGKHLNQYTYGVSLLNFPAFCVAHLITKVTSYSSDGYSEPYVLLINLNGLLFILIGGAFLYLLLNKYYGRNIALTTSAILLLGTNLYFTAVLQSAMAHGFLFCLVSLLLWFGDQLKEYRRGRDFLLIAFITGLIVLIRPNVLIVGLMPFFIASKEMFSFIKRPPILLLAAIIFFIPMLPQILYWKAITGNFITYSYGEQQFDFANPHIKEGLTGFKNGWLTYSPLMLLAVIGLVYGSIKRHRIILGASLIFVIHTYVIYSWWCWNYINGFGSRAMIDIYPILAIPMAYLFYKMRTFQKIKYLISILIILLIGLNIFQTYQHAIKVLWSEGANAAYYNATFGKTTLDHNALVALDTDIIQPKNTKFERLIATENFEKDLEGKADSIIVYSGKRSYCIQPGSKFSPEIKVSLDSSFSSEHCFRVSAMCLSKAYSTFHQNSHLVLSVQRDGKQIFWRSVRINNKIRSSYYSVHNGEINIWKEVFFYIPFSEINIKKGDTISVIGWNRSKVPVVIDDLRLELWKKT